ncbi:MAG: hypothetical protein ABSE95_13155 [Thermodesulfobacteriota bacterium]|jgi:hypothetical protein
MYPEDTIQAYVGSWWKGDKDPGIKRGRLIWGFVPHVPQVPMVLVPIGRSDPTDHRRMQYKLEPLKAVKYPKLSRLPVAALPLVEGEMLSVYKAKKRPLLVVSIGGPEISKEITKGSPKWQTLPAMLVAPFYGAVFDGKRAGFSEEFVRRVRRCEYPQYLYDKLPESGRTEESILRLDHLQPFPLFDQSYQWTPHCLSKDALMILEEWLQWLIEGTLPEESILGMYRKELGEFD